jgi:hypothetical protein
VCTVGWDRSKDQFRLGQWLRGRIYEKRGDLSPDGKHLLYFASKGTDTWTAISRAPWMKALTFYRKGDAWQGGGLFTSPRTYWLNGCHRALERDESGLVHDDTFWPEVYYNGECPGIYYLRLQRDGWRLRERVGSRLNVTAVFEKDLPGGWTLRRLCHEECPSRKGKGCYWDEHELQSATEWLEYRDWEWADWDASRGLVFAEGGCLHRADMGPLGPENVRVIYDFSPMSFEAIEAPY